jgi:hypothetical protein
MVEEGYAFPQTLAVASDSHSNMYGGIGCLGTPVVRTDAVALWVTGRTWWQVPPVAKLQLYNRLPPGAAPRTHAHAEKAVSETIRAHVHICVLFHPRPPRPPQPFRRWHLVVCISLYLTAWAWSGDWQG